MTTLNTTNSVDLRVTKDDLIDIIIDEQLTKLEKSLETLNNTLKVLKEKHDFIYDASTQRLNKRLMKSFPSTVKVDKELTPKLAFYRGYESTDVKFNYPGFIITVHQVNCIEKLTKVEQEKLDSVLLEQREVDLQIKAVSSEIKSLEGNSKRVKAKMLKSFLNKTAEGQSILNILNENDKTTKLLSN